MNSWARFPFVRYTAALAAGITGYGLTEHTPRLLVSVVAVAAAATLFFTTVSSGRKALLETLRGLSALLFLASASWLLAGFRSEQNEASHVGNVRGITAYEAVVNTLPEVKTTYVRAVVAVRRVRTLRGWQPATGQIQVLVDKLARWPRYGDVLLVGQAPGKVEGPRNPGELDYRRYLRFQNVFHRNYLNAADFVYGGNQPPSWLKANAFRLNRWADSVLTHHLSNRREIGVAKAMMLGVRDDLDQDTLRAYSASGAIHVLSVSGLHVTILFGLLAFLFSRLKQTGRAGTWLFAALMLSVLWSYALLTGLSPAVLRSAAMISFFVLRDAFGKQPSTYNTLFASAFFLLLWDPFLLFSAGFQLSYAAVLGILYLQPRIERWMHIEQPVLRWGWRITATALAAQLATFPLAVYYFHQFPVYFLLANPPVIALSTVTLPLGLALLAGYKLPILGDILAWLTQSGFWLLNEAAVQTERLPHAVWRFLHLSAWETAVVYLLIVSGLALFFTRKKAYAWLVAGLAFVLSGAALMAKIEQRRQRWLVVHHVAKATAMSLIEGNTLTVLGGDAVVHHPEQLDFACAGFWAERGVRRLRFVSFENPQPLSSPRIEALPTGGWAVAWQGQRFLGITQPAQVVQALVKPAFCLVVGTATRPAPSGPASVVFVLDGSCRASQVRRWRQANQPVYATAERGAWVRRF
jgi:competence protein ComEC